MQKSALSATACAVFKRIYPIFLLILLAAGGSAPLFAQSGEAGLRLPDLHSALFLGTIPGPTLLMVGLPSAPSDSCSGSRCIPTFATCRCMSPCSRFPS